MRIMLVVIGLVFLLAGCNFQADRSTEAQQTPTPDLLLASSCQVALLGTWQEGGDAPRIITIRNFAGIYRLTYEYADGTTESVVLGVKNVDGVVRFYEDAEKMEGEYWTIGKEKELELWNGKGLVRTISKQGQ